MSNFADKLFLLDHDHVVEMTKVVEGPFVLNRFIVEVERC